MNILNRYTNLVIAGVLDYSSCENIISFNSENRKDYELYKTLISKFKNIKHSTFIKEKEVNKDNVLKKFYEAMYDQNNEDLFIFYFTGHGSLSENNEPGLLMSNGDIISKTELKNIIKQNYQNQTIILLGDFCYSGLLADIAIELNNDDFNVNAITSASSNLSTENWSYTQTLIDSFNGRSIIDKDNKGFINFMDVAKEVQNVMFNRERQKSDFFLQPDFVNYNISNAKMEVIKNEGDIKYDEWYCSHEGIARVIGFKNNLVEVEYYHYNKYKFESLKESDLSPIQIADFSVGDHIDVNWEGEIHKAIIESVDRIFYKVSYIGWGSEWNEWITKHRIVGNEKIEILLDDTWYQGEILQKKDNQFFVRYNGYDTCYDEWVNKSRIKFN